jgi:hypothetical protein
MSVALRNRFLYLLFVGQARDATACYADRRLKLRTKKDRSLELTSILHECTPGRRKVAVKVVDIFGNDTMTIVDVSVGKNGGKK